MTRHGHTIRRDSFDFTEQDREKVLNKYFPEGTGGRLTTFHMQQKHKYIVLIEIAKRFETERKYSEKQVNELLKEVHDDYVEIRRYLVDYGLLEREPDGSQYWLGSHTDQQSAKVGKQERKEKGEQEKMNRRKELQEQAKEVKTEAGVYQIRNERNGKVYIDSTLNLKTINGQRFMLQMGSHLNRRLQAEWNEYGETAFVIEVLETLKQDDNPYYDSKDALAKCLNRWFEQLEPYGDQGYHGDKKQSV